MTETIPCRDWEHHSPRPRRGRGTFNFQHKEQNIMYLGKLPIIGHLGRDPEIRFTPAGKAVTNFNVAVNNQFTGSDGEVVKETFWFRCSAWGKTAEVCNTYLK